MLNSLTKCLNGVLQLVLTVGLLAVVVYLYTVVAFNFFRKFYNKSEDEDEPDMKCDDMMTCYLFHMYVGVRAGGGIGDELEDPAGDPYELYRFLFDITFFFFVIVILLAIIQGLIIDAFGELRDQQEQVKEDMEVRLVSVLSLFLMYLINKDETEQGKRTTKTLMMNIFTEMEMQRPFSLNQQGLSPLLIKARSHESS
ncbi:ryanodine receptor 3-like [Nothobranchius furzeri]|uniref:Ryanodine receptor 3-like n=1 Tax=Nothobranchius furzeri TaxID=105023 RepID=A0A9D2Z2W3_NOTFU|nr:ryanodine receptor 3-like [Nothobranchius furzeri]